MGFCDTSANPIKSLRWLLMAWYIFGARTSTTIMKKIYKPLYIISDPTVLPLNVCITTIIYSKVIYILLIEDDITINNFNNIIQILLWMGFITAYNKQGPCHATDALSSCLPRISVAIGLICGIGWSLPPMRKYFNCLCNYKFEGWNELPKMYIYMLKTISYLKGQWISSCYLIKYVVLPLIATDIPAPTTGGY